MSLAVPIVMPKVESPSSKGEALAWLKDRQPRERLDVIRALSTGSIGKRASSRSSNATYNESFFPAFLSPAAIPVTSPLQSHIPGGPDGKSRSQPSHDLEHELATNMSILQVNITRVGRQGSRREQLLALFSLR